MNRTAILISLVFLFTVNIFADIPPPPVGEQIRIELNKDYPDYNFYLASYDLKVVPNPNAPHPSRPNMVVTIPETFKFRQIDLSVEKPLTETITSVRIQNRGTLVGNSLYLVAIKKSLGAEDIESKIKTAIDNPKNVDGIYVAYLTQDFESRNNSEIGVKIIVNKIVNLDNKGLKIEVSEGSTLQVLGKSTSCIGLGFLLTGLAFVGIWRTRKKII